MVPGKRRWIKFRLCAKQRHNTTLDMLLNYLFCIICSLEDLQHTSTLSSLQATLFKWVDNNKLQVLHSQFAEKKHELEVY